MSDAAVKMVCDLVRELFTEATTIFVVRFLVLFLTGAFHRRPRG